MPALKPDQRGLSESAQWAVAWPLLLLVTIGIIQTGLYLHGRNVAHRASAAAVELVRGSFGDVHDAERLARAMAAGGGLREVEVRVTRSASAARVEVRGSSPAILDLGFGRVAETATAPVERVTRP